MRLDLEFRIGIEMRVFIRQSILGWELVLCDNKIRLSPPCEFHLLYFRMCLDLVFLGHLAGSVYLY